MSVKVNMTSQQTPRQAAPFPMTPPARKRPFDNDRLSNATMFTAVAGRAHVHLPATPKETTGKRRCLTRSPSPRIPEESFFGQLNTPINSYLAETQSPYPALPTRTYTPLLSPGDDCPFRTSPNNTFPGPVADSKTELPAEEATEATSSVSMQPMLLFLKQANDIEIEAMEGILKVLVQKRERLSALGQA